MTKINISPAWKDVKPQGFYVYIHRRITDRKIFYVGMGQRHRAWNTHSRNKKWDAFANKHGVIIEICQDSMDKESAFLLEMWIIAKLRFYNHELCNFTDGGDGAINSNQSTRTRILKRNSMGGHHVYCSNGMDFITASEAARWLKSIGHYKSCPGGISMVCHGKSNFYKEFGWSYKQNPKGPEKSIDLRRMDRVNKYSSKKVISSIGEEFISMANAARFLRTVGYPKAMPSAISANILGKIKYAYGRTWKIKG